MAEERLQLLGKCGKCAADLDKESFCPVCWRMVLLAGDSAAAVQLLSQAEAQVAAAPPAGGHGKRKQKQKQLEVKQEEQSDAGAAAAEAAAAEATAAEAAEAAAADARDVSPPAPAPAAEAEEATPASLVDGSAGKGKGEKAHAEGGKYSVDEAVKAEVLAQRARGDIVLGCGRCRYRSHAGCVDCRHKASLQMVRGGCVLVFGLGRAGRGAGEARLVRSGSAVPAPLGLKPHTGTVELPCAHGTCAFVRIFTKASSIIWCPAEECLTHSLGFKRMILSIAHLLFVLIPLPFFNHRATEGGGPDPLAGQGGLCRLQLQPPRRLPAVLARGHQGGPGRACSGAA